MVDDFAGDGVATNKVLFKAWKTKNLKSVPIPEALADSIAHPPEGKLMRMNFVGKSQYLMQVIRIKKDVKHQKGSIRIPAGSVLGPGAHGDAAKGTGSKCKTTYYLHYRFFNAATGQKVFEIDNLYEREVAGDVRMLSLLVNEKVAKNHKYDEGDLEKEYGEEDDEDEVEEEDEDEYLFEEEEEEEQEEQEEQEEAEEEAGDQGLGDEDELSQQEEAEHEGGEMEFQEIDTTQIDLDLVFFFVAPMKAELTAQQRQNRVDEEEHGK